MNLASSSCGGDGKQTRQEIPEHPDGDNYDEDKDKKSLSEANKQKEEDVTKTVQLVRCTLAAPSLPPMIIKEMEEMFLRLGFSQTVAMKLVDDQGIDSPQTLANLSNEDIEWEDSRQGGADFCLAANNLRLRVFMFKTMEYCSKDNKISGVNSTSVLCYQHQ